MLESLTHYGSLRHDVNSPDSHYIGRERLENTLFLVGIRIKMGVRIMALRAMNARESYTLWLTSPRTKLLQIDFSVQAY